MNGRADPLALHSQRAAALVLLALVTGNCAHAPVRRTEASDPNPAEAASTPQAPPAGEVDSALFRAATQALGEREGCILIMDPRSGRVRAVVNSRLAYEQAFPPGSTIKAFTSLAAMRSGLIDPHSAIRCEGQYAGKEFQVVCSHPKSQAPFDLPQALAYSCNYYFARTAERLSNGVFQATLAGFGFGARTGVAGSESSGRIPGPDWNIKTALGEGDQLLVTPIQLLRAYVALVCGGHLFRPREGDWEGFKADETASQSIAAAERAAIVRGMRGAVVYGTAAESGLKSLPPYVFGKTGTSTSSSGFRTQGWFVGFAAASEADDQPLLAVLAFLKHSHGSECAALSTPVFAEYARLMALPKLESSNRATESAGALEMRVRTCVPSGIHIGSIQESSGSRLSQPILQSAIWKPPGTVKVHLVRENVTRSISVEQYVLGVLRAEASIETRIEALKAQAIVSRTFALKNAGRHRDSGYDFCSLTHCQRYSETPMKGDRDAIGRRAVVETEGQVLLDERGAPIDPYFHASCGGMTADIGDLWGVPAPSYLRGVRDDYCQSMPNSNWTQRISVERLGRALQSDPKTDIGSRLSGIRVIKRDHTGRAELLELAGKRRSVVRGWDFKMIVGRSLGWNMIKSSKFEVARDGADFVFRGSGFGHGLGLCQEGAHEMARLGFSYTQIIGHYFPGTSVATYPTAGSSGSPNLPLAPVFFRNIPGASGFQPASREVPIPATSWTAVPGAAGFQPAPALAVIQAVTPGQKLSSEHFTVLSGSPAVAGVIESVLAQFESARSDLIGRLNRASLSVGRDDRIELVFHRTTQDFMAATGQPWWAAAAIRGTIIEFQPLAVLKKRQILGTTIRHEYAHYVIDRLSGGRAPRWLAEGLAAHFAGEAAMLGGYSSPQDLSTDEIEQRLSRASTPREMRSLYAASLRAVEDLIKSHGEPAIWKRVAFGPGI